MLVNAKIGVLDFVLLYITAASSKFRLKKSLKYYFVFCIRFDTHKLKITNGFSFKLFKW